MKRIGSLLAIAGTCLVAAAAGLVACSTTPPSNDVSPAAAAESPDPLSMPASLNELAIDYAKLVLALGEHDPDYVDAFYGPDAWRMQAKRQALSLDAIANQARTLVGLVDGMSSAQTLSDPELLPLRRRYLKIQLAALATRAEIVQGKRLSFDDEARLLYDTDAPHYSEKDFDPILKRIDRLLPKDPRHLGGNLAERYNRYVDRYAVPKDRIQAVMQTAINEARARAYGSLPLSLGERFELSLVSGKPWSAYNWYQGNLLSRIEVNTDLPIPVSRVIDLAAHEGYPGHHVYNVLLENGLVRDLGWPEYQVYALFSPQSLLAEGTADFGVGLAFPGDDKLDLTKQLFEQAGFDRTQAATYLKIATAARELGAAGIEAARRYLDGAATATQTAAWLQKYTLASPERATQRIAFFDRYRAYVINYSWGETLVKRYVEAHGDRTLGSDLQWQAFFDLISTPRTPSGLVAESGRPGGEAERTIPSKTRSSLRLHHATPSGRGGT